MINTNLWRELLGRLDVDEAIQAYLHYTVSGSPPREHVEQIVAELIEDFTGEDLEVL